MRGHIMSLNPEYGPAKQFSFHETGSSLTGLRKTIKLLVKLVSETEAWSIMSRFMFLYFYNIFIKGSNATLHVCCMSYYQAIRPYY